MSELRFDRLTGDWVVIAPERQKRGTDWIRIPEQVKPEKDCPFCAGNEHMTPPEVMALRPQGLAGNGPGWKLRVVPNKFPALSKTSQPVESISPLFVSQSGFGNHEVLIESPDHNFCIESAAIGHLELWLAVIAQRMLAHKKQMEVIYTTLFKNSGRSAGASLAHPHSQLIALPIVPNRIRRELLNMERYYLETKQCLVCELIKEEMAEEKRIVYDSENYVVLIPFASRYPYETWILPKAHEPFYECLLPARQAELATLIQRVRQAQLGLLHAPEYNLMLLTGPKNHDYHWRLMMIPKISNIAGLERGTDLYINLVPPEIAAQKLADSLSLQFD